MKYTCPVCGNNLLTSAPEDYSICPCCRTEYEVSDTYYSYAELRQAWIEHGALWGIKYVPAPADWSPVVQLKNISYVCSSTDLRHIALARATSPYVSE